MHITDKLFNLFNCVWFIKVNNGHINHILKVIAILLFYFLGRFGALHDDLFRCTRFLH